jgi:hypothetical protein
VAPLGLQVLGGPGSRAGGGSRAGKDWLEEAEPAATNAVAGGGGRWAGGGSRAGQVVILSDSQAVVVHSAPPNPRYFW